MIQRLFDSELCWPVPIIPKNINFEIKSFGRKFYPRAAVFTPPAKTKGDITMIEIQSTYIDWYSSLFWTFLNLCDFTDIGQEIKYFKSSRLRSNWFQTLNYLTLDTQYVRCQIPNTKVPRHSKQILNETPYLSVQ